MATLKVKKSRQKPSRGDDVHNDYFMPGYDDQGKYVPGHPTGKVVAVTELEVLVSYHQNAWNAGVVPKDGLVISHPIERFWNSYQGTGSRSWSINSK
jgi:hypothetical protein